MNETAKSKTSMSYQTDGLHGAKQNALKVIDILSQRARLERRRADLEHLHAEIGV